MAVTPKTERDWKIEGAADTLLEAEKIKRDRPLLRAAVAELKKRGTAIDAVLPKAKERQNRRGRIQRKVGRREPVVH